MFRLPPRLGLMLLLLATVPGCSFYARNSIRSIWADCNTLGAPALFLEKQDHLPYHKVRVQHYRWMYDMGPVLPTAPRPPMVGDLSYRVDAGCADDRCATPPAVPAAPAGDPRPLSAPAAEPLPPVPPPPSAGLSIEGPTAAVGRGVHWADHIQAAGGDPEAGASDGRRSVDGAMVRRPRGAWLFGPSSRGTW